MVIKIALSLAVLALSALNFYSGAWNLLALARQKRATGKVLAVAPLAPNSPPGTGPVADVEYAAADGAKRVFKAGLPSFDSTTKPGDSFLLDLAGPEPEILQWSSARPDALFNNLGKVFAVMGLSIAAVGGMLLLF